MFIGENMGKAFTEEERSQIKKQIMEAGYKLFNEQGVQKVTIREITSQVGIAQGGFYSFFKDKEELILAILNERYRIKLEYILSLLPGTEKDPMQYIRRIILHSSKHIYEDLFYSSQKQDVLDLLRQEEKMVEQKNEEAVLVMESYWRTHGKEVKIDSEKLLTAIGIAVSLTTNRKYMNTHCFQTLFLGTVDYLVSQCIQVK